jgi:hypothetical protein
MATTERLPPFAERKVEAAFQTLVALLRGLGLAVPVKVKSLLDFVSAES